MYKKRQVVSVKGKNEAKIGELLISNRTMFVANADPINIHPYYIYILSDDPIKDDDWFILLMNSNKHELHQKGKNDKSGINFNTESPWVRDCKKVIATNDPELNKGWIRDNDPQRLDPDYIHITTMNGVPKLSVGFIQKFVEKYNIKYPMTEIMVEYEYITTNEDWSKRPVELTGYEKLKVNPDGTIHTKDEQTSWSREEVIRLCSRAWLKIPNDPNMLENFDKWVENNL